MSGPPLLAIQAGVGAFAGFATAFLAINVGLRLMAEGRAFLAAARAEGRLLANPGPGTPAAVRAVFALATAAAIVAGIAGFFATGALLWTEGPAPVPVATPAA